MEEYMKDDYESYQRYVSKKCPCGCLAHCGHSCLDCDNCSDCECQDCIKGQGNN